MDFFSYVSGIDLLRLLWYTVSDILLRGWESPCNDLKYRGDFWIASTLGEIDDGEVEIASRAEFSDRLDIGISVLGVAEDVNMLLSVISNTK